MCLNGHFQRKDVRVECHVFVLVVCFADKILFLILSISTFSFNFYFSYIFARVIIVNLNLRHLQQSKHNQAIHFFGGGGIGKSLSMLGTP